MHKRQLLKIIDEVAKSGRTSLNLSRNVLSELPPKIGQLNNLISLRLELNRLRELPTKIGQLYNLTYLDLSDNQLSELPPEIGQLYNLTYLDLSGNQLSELPPEIGQLNNLTSLNLSGNQLSELPPEIGQLNNLTELNLRRNVLSELSLEISQLNNLISLRLELNRLSELPPEISQLNNLILLNLSENQLSELSPEIGQLKSLTELNLSNNQLSELSPEISQVNNLTWLNLSGNQLRELPSEIGQLNNLTSLNLSGNQLRESPPEIGQLNNLSGNQLSELPPEIGQLNNLTSLNLNENQLRELPSEIGQLNNLIELNLSRNVLSELPPEIGQLKSLTELNLSENQLSELPPEIGQLNNLIELNLSRNVLSDLPPEIGQLNNLFRLELGNDLKVGRNQLSKLPSKIGQLNNLTYLDVSGNQLSELPPEIGQLNNLFGLELDRNPLVNPPPEIVKQGIHAIRNYFIQLEDEAVTLYEAKLLIVGEPGAGKTTLAQKIKDKNYQLQDEPSTEGIDIVPWQFSGEKGRPFKVNIWDFGGQEIYQATHQFFLTKRSLYILLVDDRKEDTDFYYWLNTIELLSDNSPVLIVKNEKQGRRRAVALRQLQSQFENLEDALPTDLKHNTGLADIIDRIQHHLPRLPHIGNELPKTWVDVRAALANSKRDYISLEKYLDICEENKITNLDFKLQLSEYLHDLGVCLHFQDEPLLNKTVILNPEWGTDAVYNVLDTKEVQRNLGRFTKADLAEIWAEDKYRLMHNELLQLMIKFQICYPLSDFPDTYIAPQLLSEDKPIYEWDNNHNLIMRYRYPFLPKGIITRFIVAIHRLIQNQDNVWKSGVILEKNDTLAEVIEFYDRREIRIRVQGSHRRDLLTIINYELDAIHHSFENLQVERLIPCYCPKCNNSQRPHAYRYENLLYRLSNRRFTVECDRSFEIMEIRRLMGGVGIILTSDEVTDYVDQICYILHRLPVFADQDNRTQLLHPFAEQPCEFIKRSSSPSTDLRNIVNTVGKWGVLKGGKLGLTILAERALSMVGPTTSPGQDLQEYIYALETLQGRPK
ncbi:MAG: COR domain-containing protein [Chloroflexota bacterium]